MADHTAALADLLDLDGEVLHDYWADAVTWLRREARGPRRRIVDLGAGSGVGTIALAQRFRDAEVVAVDAQEAMLERVRAKALDLGLAARVRTVRADLDEEWPITGPVDVTWASLSLHHLAEPDRVLGRVFAATRPGGLLAVAETSVPPRFLPDELGAGFEQRCLDAARAEHAGALPHLGADWAPRIEAAGFALLGERRFPIDVRPPHSPVTVRYAERWLRRLREGAGPRLPADDRAVLDSLLDGDGPATLARRGDLHLRGDRTVTLARRP